jgi:hypothetical protein
MKNLRSSVVVLTLVSVVVPKAALPAAEAGAAQVSPIIDIALRAEGILEGQVLGTQGHARRKCRVSICEIHELDRVVASADTDQQGRFRIENLSGGVYVIQAETTSGIYRIWAPCTAPPVARQDVLLVIGSAVRGQDPSDLTFPSLVAIGLIGGFVTLIAVSQDRDDAS